MKTCIMCGIEKPHSEYYRHAAMADGHLGRCKECHKLGMKRVRSENPEKYRAKDRERAKTKSRKESFVRKSRNKRSAAGPAYTRSHNAVAMAIKKGTLIRPDHCERCLIPCAPQGHHDDYEKPLEVMWLCPICHAARHSELGRLSGTKRS